MSMSRVLGVGVFGVMLAVGYVGLEADKKEAVTRFGLNEKQVAFMDACMSSMSRHDVKFRYGAGRAEGCACVAKEMTQALVEVQYDEASAVLNALFSGGEKGDRKAIQVSMDLAKEKYKIANGDVVNYMRLAGRGVKLCGRKSYHETKDATT